MWSQHGTRVWVSGRTGYVAQVTRASREDERESEWAREGSVAVVASERAIAEANEALDEEKRLQARQVL